MIRNVLEHPFCKVALDHLVVNDKLILEPKKVKSKVNKIMVGWIHKWEVFSFVSGLWTRQYALLVHVNNDAFSSVISKVNLDEFLLVILSICNKSNILYGDNFSVLRGTSTQSSVFAVGLVVVLSKIQFGMHQDVWQRNTLGNCKNSLREDPKQWVDFSSASEKEYINTHNNQKLKNNLHRNIKKKAFSITEETKVVTKTPNLTVLEFCHAIYTQNQSDLGLPEECCPAESALTYYINARINYHIGKEEEPHDAKLGLYRELSQYTTKEVAQYAKKNFLISTGNTRERANKTKENLETNQESNQQKLGTPAQTPKKTVTQSIKKQRIYSPEDKSYHFSPENKIQIPLGAASSSTSTPQMLRTPKEELDIREAIFRNAQRNIIPPPLRPISPSAENGNEMTTPYIARLTDFSEEEEMDMHTWLREAQKAIQANNWNNQRAIQTLPFFLKGTADLWYQSLETKPTSFTEFKNAFLELFSNPNTIIQLQNEFNTIKQNTSETIEVIKQGYYTDPQILNQFIRGLKSSILGRVCPAHPNSLPEAITLVRALESTEKEANHSQIVNIVIEENKTETLEKRVTQFGKKLSKKIESYFILDLRRNTYQPPQRCSQEVSNSRNNCSSHQEFRTETRACHFCKCVEHLISQCQMQIMQEACENNYYTSLQMSRNQYMPILYQYPITY
ncbi:hypothetical protein G9A89_019248 [Geosiphon pyriformis]|nr:hypothetical protein G9A89_019248 [Geosiphon pyriformis]